MDHLVVGAGVAIAFNGGIILLTSVAVGAGSKWSGSSASRRTSVRSWRVRCQLPHLRRSSITLANAAVSARVSSERGIRQLLRASTALAISPVAFAR